MSEQPPTSSPARRNPVGGALSFAIGAGVVLALVDLGLGLARTELLGLRAVDLADPLAAGTLLGALLVGTSELLLARPLGARVGRGALRIGLLSGWTTLVLVADVAGTMGEPGAPVVTGLVGVGTGLFAARAFAGRELAAPRLALAAAVMIELAAFLVLLRGASGLGAAGRAGAVVALALAVPATVRAFGARPLRGHGGASLVVLGALVLAMPLGARAVPRARHRPAPTSAAPRVPRVLLIVVDTLRLDALSCMAETAPPTPHVDALAARSVGFGRAWAPAPWTLPSVASIMTGVSPLVHRATAPHSQLPPELATLAERFAAAGYDTAAIGQNPFLSPRSGLDRGFAEYRMLPDPELELRCLSAALLRAWRGGPRGLALPAPELTDAALEWADEHGARPFFLSLHYFDAHLPYAPPPELVPAGPPAPGMGAGFGGLLEVRGGSFAPTPEQRRWIRALYDGEVRLLDRELGRLLDGFQGRGLLEDALVVLTSDHGEEFWEHGGFEHGHAFHEELLRVPLFVKLPRQRAGRMVETPVSLVGLAPTLLGLCGLPFDPKRFSQPPFLDAAGEPLPPPADPGQVAAGNLYFDPRFALRAGDTKYVVGVVDGAEELYDLARDPLERRSLTGTEPERLAAARALLDAAVGAAEALRARLGLGAPPTSPLSTRQLELLRGGGYFGIAR